MNSRERIKIAMNLGVPDRIPVMCQLSIGHYFLFSGVDPVDAWFTSSGFAEALVTLQRRYRFDGILVNLPGRDPDWRTRIAHIKTVDGETIVTWKNGAETHLYADNNPRYVPPVRKDPSPGWESIRPQDISYVEPWDLEGIRFPVPGATDQRMQGTFPYWQADTLRAVREKAGDEVSIHAEIFSPWSQWVELVGLEDALLSILFNPNHVLACLQQLTRESIALGTLYRSQDTDAILVSSAYAGAGFISRDQYATFVLPFERDMIEQIRNDQPFPVYTHTCGAIGDRLDLMLETGTSGIDTLDPPPLGTVNLGDAVKILERKAFIKGNLDPVNTLLNGTRSEIIEAVQERIRIAGSKGGYILSSACSVAPHTPPENLMLLSEEVNRLSGFS